ncbi:MAG: helix-turn-helix transcriptional regulator [Desulfobacterium sp.]|nr:helix-turn-helix transcriptional regulator [Desulfobacterium sp.]
MKTIEDVKYYRLSGVEGIEACRVVRSSHVFPKHTHNHNYTVILVEEGQSYCLGPEKTDSCIVSEEVALINPGQVHSGVPAGKSTISYWGLCIDATVMTRSAGQIFEREGLEPELQHLIARDRILSKRLKDIFINMVNPSGKLEMESALLETVAHLVSQYSSPNGMVRAGNEPRAVSLAKEFLSENLDEKVSLEDVAGAVGLSRYHFLRVFKRATGLPPHAFRTQQRIRQARHLMRSGVPFAEVALETGFTDQSHFTNKFRQLTGATPRQYVARL